MMPSHAARIVSVVSTLLLAGLAHADTVTLQPSRDNTLYEPIVKDGLADRSNGAGTTMFAGVPEQVRLALTKTRSFRNGNVVLWYERVP